VSGARDELEREEHSYTHYAGRSRSGLGKALQVITAGYQHAYRDIGLRGVAPWLKTPQNALRGGPRFLTCRARVGCSRPSSLGCWRA